VCFSYHCAIVLLIKHINTLHLCPRTFRRTAPLPTHIQAHCTFAHARSDALCTFAHAHSNALCTFARAHSNALQCCHTFSFGQAQAEREAAEMAECTFHPRTNPLPAYLWKAHQVRQEHLATMSSWILFVYS